MPPKTKRTVVSGPVVTDLAPPVVVELPVELPELTVRVPPVPVLFAAGVPFPPLPEEELLLEPGSELEPPPSPLLVLPPGKLEFPSLHSTLAPDSLIAFLTSSLPRPRAEAASSSKVWSSFPEYSLALLSILVKNCTNRSYLDPTATLPTILPIEVT